MIDEGLTFESANLATLLDDPTVAIVAHLAKNAIDPEFNYALIGDMVECDFDGYDSVQLGDWDITQHEDDFVGEAISAPLEFTAGDAIVPQKATAVYLAIYRTDDVPRIWRVYPLEPNFMFDLPGRTLRRQIRVTSVDDTQEPAD